MSALMNELRAMAERADNTILSLEAKLVQSGNKLDRSSLVGDLRLAWETKILALTTLANAEGLAEGVRDTVKAYKESGVISNA